jgi:glucans biosynthesis protein
VFLHGENQPSASDFRPEVHDSDGLLVAAGRAGGATEWLWRPLFNPPRPLASSFAVERLQGFGLMQRDGRFSAYEDTVARYERRPSAWVEPIGDWGPGRVQLLLLPTPDETHDNVAATWVPARLPAPGQPLVLSWRLHWQGKALQQPPGAWTVQSRRGHGWLPADPAARPRDELKFTLDFDGPALRALPADAAPEVVASLPQAGRARITEARTWRHPEGGFRVLLRVQRPEPQQPLDLRVYLRRGDAALSETWASLVPPDAPSTP